MLTYHEHNRHWTRKHGKFTFQRNCGTTSMRMYHAQFKKGSFFPSKIALYSHVPSVFPYIFPVHHICLPPAPHHRHPPLKRIYRDLVVPTFPALKHVLLPLFPAIFLLCSLVPQNHRDTLNTVTLKTAMRFAYGDGHTTELLQASVRPCCCSLFFCFCFCFFFVEGHNV